MTLLRLRRLVPFLVGGAALVILVAGLRATAEILNPVLFATFLALLMQPVSEWMEKRRVPAGLATTAVVLVTLVSGLAVVGFMAASLQDVAAAAPQYADRLAEQAKAAIGALQARGVEVDVDLETLPDRVLRSREFSSTVISVTQGALGALGNLGLTFFIFAFMVGGVSRLDARLERGEGPRTELAVRFVGFAGTIRRYMGVRSVLGLVASVLNYFLLLALGVDFALLWAVLSFVLSFVPNIGYTMSVIPPVLLALVEGGWQKALGVFLGYTVINNVVDNVIGPRYVGAEMKMSALLSFLSVIFWAWVLGPTGAILAIPITVFLRDVVLSQPGLSADAAPSAAVAEAPPADAKVVEATVVHAQPVVLPEDPHPAVPVIAP